MDVPKLAPTVSAPIGPTPAERPETACVDAGSALSFPNRLTRSAIANRRGSRGGRPLAFNAEDYKGRNVVERNFNVVKQWRGLATRYDKLAIVYRAAAVLRAITLWLPHLSDTP